MKFKNHDNKVREKKKTISKNLFNKIKKFYSLPELLEPIIQEKNIIQILPAKGKIENNVDLINLLNKIKILFFLPELVTPLEENFKLNLKLNNETYNFKSLDTHHTTQNDFERLSNDSLSQNSNDKLNIVKNYVNDNTFENLNNDCLFENLNDKLTFQKNVNVNYDNLNSNYLSESCSDDWNPVVSSLSILDRDLDLSDSESCFSENYFDDNLNEVANNLEKELLNFTVDTENFLDKKSMPSFDKLIKNYNPCEPKINDINIDINNIQEKKLLTSNKICKKNQNFKKFLLNSNFNLVEPKKDKKLDLEIFNKLVRNSNSKTEPIFHNNQFESNLTKVNKQRLNLKIKQNKLIDPNVNIQNLNIVPKSKILTLKGTPKNTDLQKLLLSIRCKS